MKTKRLWIVLLVIPVCLISVLIVGGQRSQLANASGVIDPTCVSSLPCIEYDNNGTGPAIRGIALGGNGVAGSTHINSTSTTNARAGVFGKDDSTSGTFNSGVNGLSVRGIGVTGQSTTGVGISGTSSRSFGVQGTSTGNDGIAGISQDGIGAFGQSTNYLGVYGAGPTYGLYGSAASGYGAVGVSSNIGVYGGGSSYGVYGSGGNGKGIYGSTGSGVGVFAQSVSGRAFEGHTTSGLGLYLTNGSGNGGDVTGSYVGVVARSDTFPLVATNLSGGNLFYVDGVGNVFYHGTLHSFAITRTGNMATTFHPTAASPTVEDTGSAELINGSAVVALDPAFAETIDPRAPYHVMLTPDGDTRGLYVATKGPNSFVVREVQGGRNSLTFDYHIYAPALGHAGERMVVLSRAAAAMALPKAPVLTWHTTTVAPPQRPRLVAPQIQR